MTGLRRFAPALAAIALVSCGSGHSHSPLAGTTTSTAPATSSATGATTSTTELATTTTQAGGPYATFTTPNAAVMAFVKGWLTRDSAAASHAATPAAIFSLFSNPVPASTPDFRGCNAGLGGMSTCIYRVGASSGLQIRLQDVPPTHWRVVEAQFLS